MLKKLTNRKSNEEFTHKREFPRRQADKCVAVINGQMYPVQNWSMGGVLIETDSRMFGNDNLANITLRFRIMDRMIDIPQPAHVIRKGRDHVAFAFEPLNEVTRKRFQNVINDMMTREFARSQV